METSIQYSGVEDVNVISRWDAGHKFCIRITVSDGSVLLQVSSNSLDLLSLLLSVHCHACLPDIVEWYSP